MLFHGASAKEVSCIRRYSTELFSARVAIIIMLSASNSEILNTWLWRMCTALIDHLWMVMGHFSSWMNNEDLGKTPLSPLGNCRLDSSNAAPKPQSQQMISLTCTTASALLAFMGEWRPNEARGRLRVDIGNGISEWNFRRLSQGSNRITRRMVQASGLTPNIHDHQHGCHVCQANVPPVVSLNLSLQSQAECQLTSYLLKKKKIWLFH